MDAQELLVDLAIVGGCILAHFGILANRNIIRPALKFKSPKYDKVSLQFEHVVHHASSALAISVALKYLKMDPESIRLYSVAASLAKGIYHDGFQEEKPQLDQLVSDTVGCGIGYYLISSF